MTPEKLATLRVLVVDDEPLIRWSLRETLTPAGFEVVEASNAREALDRLDGPEPDVVVLDYRLPDSNDLRLLETIRRRIPGCPVIMMTAYGTPELEAGALERGAFRVLGKPFEMRDVAKLIRQARAARS